MGGLGGGNKSSSTPGGIIGGMKSDPTGLNRKISSGGFIDDGAKRMPTTGDAVASEAAKRLRAKLTGRSGRAATDLSGTRSFVNTFLGGSG